MTLLACAGQRALTARAISFYVLCVVFASYFHLDSTVVDAVVVRTSGSKNKGKHVHGHQAHAHRHQFHTKEHHRHRDDQVQNLHVEREVLDLNAAGQQKMQTLAQSDISLVQTEVAVPKGTVEGRGMTKPVGYGMCVKFFRNRKGQDVQGESLVKVTGSMCENAVDSGAAQYRFKQACREIQDIVATKYATPGVGPMWEPELLCEDVMTRFQRFAPSNSKGFQMQSTGVL